MILGYIKTILALVNSMIGSAILILPIIYIQNGIIFSLGVTIATGFCSCYSNIITLEHMAEDEIQFEQTIKRHNKKVDQFPWFVLFVFLSTQILFYLYFNLIMKQWTGLFYRLTWLLPYLPQICLVTLVLITLAIKRLHFGVTLMALGIVSVIFTILFYFWMFFSRPQTHKQFPKATMQTPATLFGLMIQAFCIQNVFVEILRQHPSQKQRKNLISITYALGVLIYFCIGTLGGYGILGREPIVQGAKTIMGYFYADRWQPCLLEIIYLIHLYSVWPQWSVVNGNRLFQILGVESTEFKLNTYLIISPCIAFACYMLNVNLQLFISLNGGICLFFALFAIPIYTHVKCRYLHDHQYCLNNQIQQQIPEWAERDEKCQHYRQIQTQSSRIVDITILVIMSLFALTSLTITIKHTFFKGAIHH